MSSTAAKSAAVVAAIVVVGVLLGFYVGDWLMGGPKAYDVSAAPGSKSVNLTLETVAAVGPKLAENPDWVSYLVQNEQGRWLHTTIWRIPAHTLVHVTVYQFDGNSGLRNPYMSLVRGTVGGTMQLDGKTTRTINPNDASHTFAVPALGLIVPLAGVADDAKNQCNLAPCALSNAHRTITFSFRTPGPGRYRWQCFVPCAAGFLDGFGGPMQTLGYMDGFLNVA